MADGTVLAKKISIKAPTKSLYVEAKKEQDSKIIL